MSRRSEPFDAGELEAIRAAVVAAEARSAGEIVTVIVERCDAYQGALWKSAALGAMAATLIASVVHGALGYWGGSIWLWLALPAWAGAGLGFVAPLLLPALHRGAVGAHVLDARVATRARAAFAESEVFATRARTGLLLFVALFEHRVEVVCDRGVEEKVSAADWAPIVDRLTAGLRQGRPAQTLVGVIGEIGGLLESRGVIGAGGPDIDELPDVPTVSKE